MESVFKRCPFKKGLCNKECALYDHDSIRGCVFLELASSLEYVGEEIREVLKGQEHILSLLTKKNDPW